MQDAERIADAKFWTQAGLRRRLYRQHAVEVVTSSLGAALGFAVAAGVILALAGIVSALLAATVALIALVTLGFLVIGREQNEEDLCADLTALVRQHLSYRPARSDLRAAVEDGVKQFTALYLRLRRSGSPYSGEDVQRLLGVLGELLMDAARIAHWLESLDRDVAGLERQPWTAGLGDAKGKRLSQASIERYRQALQGFERTKAALQDEKQSLEIDFQTAITKIRELALAAKQIEIATDPSGWGKYNHPEWGKFRLAHGHGELANSGRLSLLSQVYAATGKTRELTGDDLRSAQTVEFVSRIQDAIVSYGPSDKYLLDRMAERGPGQLSAVVTYEGNVALYNEDNASRLSFPLVAVYPTEGTFWTEHPFAVLRGNWVSDEQAKAAQAFVEFALSDEQLGRAPSFALRAAAKDLPLTAPLDDAHGVVPQVSRDQVKPLVPLPTNLDAALHDLWVTAKKKAVVALAVDTSGSMSGAKIKGAREGAVAFLDAMADNDEIIFIPFSDNVTISPRSGRVGDVREELRQEMQSLIEKGNTALHQTTITSLTKIEEARAKYGEQRLYSVVLLTDGQNTKSPPQWSQVVEALPASPETAGTRIITIAYGGDADLNVLNTLATRTGGEMYKASATDIKGVYLKAAQY